MKTRLLTIGAAAALLLSGAAACTTEPEAPAGKKEITFLVFETPNLTPAYWDAAIKRVTDKYPDITVKKLVSPDQDRTKYAKQLDSSGQLPDVMIAVSPVGFAEAGKLYAWTPDELKDFEFPANGAVKGKVYQIPANTQTIPIVYYNKKQFADAGITAEPKTYAELLAAAEKLKAKSIQPFVTGGVHDNLGVFFAGIAGTDIYAKNPKWIADRRANKVKFCDAEFKGAATKLADLAAKGYVNKADVSRDYAGTQQAFLDGKGAIYPMGNWFAGALDDPKTKPAFEVGQFNWPTDDGKMVVPAFTGGGLLVNANAKNLAEARKFALAFQTDKSNMDNSAKADGLFVAVKGYTPPTDVGAAYKAGYDLYAKGVTGKAIVPSLGFEAGDDGMLAGVGAKLDSSLVDLVSGQKPPDQVCAYLDTEWQKAAG
ncbi:MAG TPA: ABC transporter substrate-binding protein [Micromonosporaceae bacterium]|nr:ABC transporter substrate-binding protein [Micromonosporaceae bacterium]HCU49504.1 ABC transporter substrate-binding protein [Micromonosporaceae bacterium]